MLSFHTKQQLFYYGECGDSITWSNDYNSDVLVLSGTGAMWNYDYRDLPAWDSYRIKTIHIPDGITSIGDHAFSSFKKMTSVSLPNSITHFGKYAFFSTELTSVTIPNFAYIDSYTFSRCIALSSVTIPDTVPFIGHDAFYNILVNSYNEYDNGLYLGNEFNPYSVLIIYKDISITSLHSFQYELI